MLALTDLQTSARPLLWSQAESSSSALTWLVGKNSSDYSCTLLFVASLPQQGASLLLNPPSKYIWNWEKAMLHVPVHTLSSAQYTLSPWQHNLLWEMSSCTEHDLRFHLPLKCLESSRIPAELAGLHILWTHCDVGGSVSVITSWVKACDVLSLEYLFLE